MPIQHHFGGDLARYQHKRPAQNLKDLIEKILLFASTGQQTQHPLPKQGHERNFRNQFDDIRKGQHRIPITD